MTLTLRDIKGIRLTQAEIDENFRHLDYRFFQTRDALVSAVAGGRTYSPGDVVTAEGVRYKWVAAPFTLISDLPGLAPVDRLSVLHFGASTSLTDNMAKFRAATTAALSYGGVVYVPSGTWLFNSTDSIDPGTGNITFIGDGPDQTILKYNEGSSGVPKYLFKNTANITKGSVSFKDLQIRGTLDVTPQRAGVAVYLDWYAEVSIENCKFYNIGGMATDFHGLQKFRCTGSHFENIAADACRCRDTSSYLVDGNFFKRIGDDVIVMHTAKYEVIADIAAGRLLPSRQIITNNIILNASRRGIVSLGGRDILISKNFMQLVGLAGIAIYTYTSLSSGQEGAVASRNIVVSGNIILDMQYIPAGVVGTPTAYIYIKPPVPRGATSTNNVRPLRYNSTTTSIVKPWDWYEVDTSDTTYPVPPLEGLLIVDNICRRTLPNVASYTSYGFGTFIDQGINYNPAIAEGNLRCGAGIRIDDVDGAKCFNASRNIIEHTSNAFYIGSASADELGLSGLIEVNQIKDATSYGILLFPNAAKNSNLRIRGNRFDCDTFRMNANSNMNGTYIANATPVGVSLGAAEGCVVTENEFLNCSTPISVTDATKNLIDRNIVWLSTPAALGFNVGNKGIGNVPSASLGFDYIITDCDPTSANYMEVANTLPRRASAMPSSGWFPAGWQVQNTAASPAGWVRLTTGSSHTLGTDWTEIMTSDRAVTGSYTVAGLPTGTSGRIAFATNGRKNGEGAGLGTGVLCFHDGTAWRACDTGATVSA